MHEPKISKLKGCYSATANLIFQSWLKDIRVHVEDQNLSEREAMQLIKDFTADHTHNKVDFNMGMVVEDQQTFEGLVQHLKNTFQSEETISKLISNFYSQAQKKNKSEDVFADDLQVLVQKIIARKPEFRTNVNEQLKSQYAHKLHDPYFVAIAHSMLQSLDSTESFSISEVIWQSPLVVAVGWKKLAPIQQQLSFPHVSSMRKLGSIYHLKTPDRGKIRSTNKPLR